MGLTIIKEANRCLQCKTPMCQQGCAVHTPIPKVIDKFKNNDLMAAGKILFENNPMSVVCSIVCDHEAQCAGHCVLGKKGSPVTFFNIEHFVSDAYLDRMRFVQKEKKGKKVAVIGSGPAGMTTCEGVFAAGDVVHGSNTVVAAVDEAKRAAQAMMKYMNY